MVEPTNNYRFELVSDTVLGTVEIAEIVDFDKNTDVYELQDQGRYHQLSRSAKVTMLEDARDYILEIIDKYGPDTDVRLITKVKDNNPLEQGQGERWKTISNVGVDLYSIELNEETQNRQISVDLITGGVIQKVESRFSDEYDITHLTETYEDKSDLPFVDIWLEARTLFRRTRLEIKNGSSGQADNLWPGRAHGMPWSVIEETRSDANLQNGSTGQMFFNANTNQVSSSGIIYSNAQRNRTLTFTMDVGVRFQPQRANFIAFYIFVFDDGQQYNYVSSYEIGRVNSTGDPSRTVRFQWSDTIQVLAGQSIGFGAVHSDFPTQNIIDFTYADSSLRIDENDRFEATCTRALKPVDLFEKLCSLIGVQWDRESTPFREGGPFENYLLVHGTWLRRVPQIINPGEDDERRVQSNISLEFLYNAFEMIAPMRYGERFTSGEQKFFVGFEKETQQNYPILTIDDITGDLQEAAEKQTSILSDSYYSRVIIGSDTSGSNYGAINNLYSIGGRAEWKTPNERSKAEYKRTSDIRTGAEDIELTRIEQYSDNPDIDSEYDNDWFIIDTKYAPEVNPECPYIVRRWEDYFDIIPQKVFSPESNYNWPFRPSNLLFNHSWKIAPAIWHAANEIPLKFNSSNCNSSLITREPGFNPIAEDQDISFGNVIGDKRFQRPTVVLWSDTFRVALNQDQVEALMGDKNGVVIYQYNGETKAGRILKASASGEFTLIEATS